MPVGESDQKSMQQEQSYMYSMKRYYSLNILNPVS